MNYQINKFFCAFFLLFLIVGCDKKTKIDSKGYDDTYQSILLEADPAIGKHRVEIPQSQINSAWNNSNWLLSNIPDNIQVRGNSLNNISYFKLIDFSKENLLRTPVIVNKKLYILDNNAHLYAYSLEDLNKPLWIATLPAPKDFVKISGGIATYEDKIIVTYGSQRVIAVNADGKELWQKSLSNAVRSAPAIYEGRVLVNTIDNRLYCLDSSTGKVIWVNDGPLENITTLRSPSTVGYKDKIIYPFSTNAINIMDINTGETNSSTSLSEHQLSQVSNINDIDVTPVVSGGNIYLSTFSGDLVSINADNGEVGWVLSKAGASENNIVWSSGDYLYSITKDNLLIAIYKLTGSIKWITDLGNIIAYNSKSKIPLSFSGPVMINSKLYIISSYGYILSFDPKGGNLLKSQEVEAKKQYTPLFAVNDEIFSLASDGNMLRIK